MQSLCIYSNLTLLVCGRNGKTFQYGAESGGEENVRMGLVFQDVTHRSESIIGNLIDKSILLDFTR